MMILRSILLGRGRRGNLKRKFPQIISFPGQQNLAGFLVLHHNLALTHRGVGDELAFRVNGVALGVSKDQNPVGLGGGRPENGE